MFMHQLASGVKLRGGVNTSGVLACSWCSRRVGNVHAHRARLSQGAGLAESFFRYQ
jgi:hypothetical protein